jgi:hypothetical protein
MQDWPLGSNPHYFDMTDGYPILSGLRSLLFNVFPFSPSKKEDADPKSYRAHERHNDEVDVPIQDKWWRAWKNNPFDEETMLDDRPATVQIRRDRQEYNQHPSGSSQRLPRGV